MNLKTIVAGTMAEALTTVKRELGPGAVILHTRKYKQGGFMGLGGRMVVEITAGDAESLGGRRPAPQRKPGTPARPQPAAEAPAGDLIRRTYAAARAELAPASAGLQASPSGAGGRGGGQLGEYSGNNSRAVSGSGSGGGPSNDELAQEMRTVKRMVEQMMKQQRDHRGPGAGLPENLQEQYLSLLKQEVEQELADEVVERVRGALSPSQLEDAAMVRAAVLGSVAGYIPGDATAGRLEPSPDGRPRTIALIGPTGVGKTTTIAKLAATFKLKQKKNIGLVTLDTYRIAAVDQLRTYASIIGVPLHVASNPEELAAALRKCAGCDGVLIDTAGRSQRDDPKLGQLKTFIQAANPHEVHLVLSSACAQGVLLESAERFAAIRADRIIFTKLDEAVSFGVLLNVARKVNKRLSYVTTGQEVPHQIEPGSPKRLAALVMGEGV